MDVVVEKEVGEEEVERLREVEKRARETQERLMCTVCQDREVARTDIMKHMQKIHQTSPR